MKSGRVPINLEELTRSIGEFIQFWGFKRIHGQIWTHMFLSKNPIDAGELIRRLGVSKALISMSLSELLRYEVILECGKGPRNTLTYCANPDLMKVILNIVRQREREMVNRIASAAEGIQALTPAERASLDMDEERMQALQKIASEAKFALESLIELSSPDLEFWRGLHMNTVTQKISQTS